MSEPRQVLHLTPGQTTTLSRVEKMQKAMREATGPESDLPVEPIKIKAQFDNETGEYIIRIPSEVTGMSVEPTHGNRALQTKIDVEFPRHALLAIEWPPQPRQETVMEGGVRVTRDVMVDGHPIIERKLTYHRLGGDKNDRQISTISLLLGLYANKEEARAVGA